VKVMSREELLAIPMLYAVSGKDGTGRTVVIRFADPITCVRAERHEWQLGPEEWRNGHFVEKPK
jgi:hypothetical protein